MQKLNPEFQLGHQVLGWNDPNSSIKIAGTYITRDISPSHDINPIKHKILTYSGRIETVRHVKFAPNADTFLTGDIVEASNDSDFSYYCQGEFLFLDLEDPNSSYTIRTGNGPVSYPYCRYPREEKLEKLRGEFLAHKATAKTNTIKAEDKFIGLKAELAQELDKINNQLRSHSSHLKDYYHNIKTARVEIRELQEKVHNLEHNK